MGSDPRQKFIDLERLADIVHATSRKRGDLVMDIGKGGHEDHRNRSRRFVRSEEHTSELQSLMRISYAVFCLKKKKTTTRRQRATIHQSQPKDQKYNTHNYTIH